VGSCLNLVVARIRGLVANNVIAPVLPLSRAIFATVRLPSYGLEWRRNDMFNEELKFQERPAAL
jgi:hypothetical protein